MEYENEVNFICLLGAVQVSCMFFIQEQLAVWYLIHFIANMYIIAMTFGPIALIGDDPIGAILQPAVYYDTMNIIALLHLYHLAFFQCTRADWFHHLFFVGLGFFTIYMFKNGYYAALSHFFLCGLPGGIDYLCLFLYRLKWITKNQRLIIAHFLNVWIRSPGLCMLAAVSVIKYLVSKRELFNTAELICQLIMTIGNGQYYMAQVVRAVGKIES